MSDATMSINAYVAFGAIVLFVLIVGALAWYASGIGNGPRPSELAVTNARATLASWQRSLQLVRFLMYHLQPTPSGQVGVAAVTRIPCEGTPSESPPSFGVLALVAEVKRLRAEVERLRTPEWALTEISPGPVPADNETLAFLTEFS